ncbi:hypothetical protein JCM3770_004266 [Rhodotorula araucariae]
MLSDFADFLPHGVAHRDDHGASSPSPAGGRSTAQLAWWAVGRVPWYLWAMVALYVWGRHVKGNGRRDDRKARRALAAGDNAPRRADPPARDVVHRAASPLGLARTSSPNLERRGSYRRYSAGAQGADERTRGGSSLRNAYSPARSSALSSPRPPPADSDPLQQTTEPHETQSTSALPRGAGPSALRHAYPSPSAPAVPNVSSQPRQPQRKRAHDDDASGSDVEAGKRSRVDAGYDFAQTDEDESAAMELDDDQAEAEALAAASPPPQPQPQQLQRRGTKRRDQDGDAGDGAEGAKRSRRAAPDVKVAAPAAQDQAGKKRRASSSSDSSSTGAAGSSAAAPVQQKKKARKAALGTGSVRDKRALDDTSFDADDALELSDDGGPAEARNADSDFDSADEAPGPTREKEPAATGAKVKRFRSRRARSGSDDDDLMGDVEPSYGGASSTAASSASSPPASARKGSSGRNARLGRLIAKQQQQARAATPQRRGGRGRGPKTSSPEVEELEMASPDTPRKVGDEWTNHEGDRYRIDADGTQRRLCEVREKRLKFRMPKDSKHPDARATHVVLVEKWLTAEEYEQAFAHRKLAWQTTFEEEARQQRMDVAASSASVAGSPVSLQTTSVEQEQAIYFTRGVGTPLRAYRDLKEILSRPGTAAGSSAPASPRASPLLANGRVRLSSGPSGGAGTPRSASRKWSEVEVRRLLEGEEAAREEREKRRRGYLAMGGDLYETEEERREREAKENKDAGPAKIKLADYAAPSATADKPVLPDTSAAPASASPAKPAALPNLFSAPSTKTAAPAAAPAPASTFSFGAPVASAEKKDDVPAPAPPSGEKKDDLPKPAAFSFGTPAAKEKKGAPDFSFGGSTAAAEEKKAAPFAFGAPPAPPAEPKKDAPAATEPKPLFGFGTAKPASAPADAAPAGQQDKPSFGFGTPATPAAKPPASFSFGAPAAPPASATSTEAPKPAFGFGTTSAAPSVPATAPPAPFSFGGAAKPAEEANKPAAPSFSFGTSAPAAAPAKPPAAAPFAFGASAPMSNTSTAAPASTGFSFGQAPAAPPAAAGVSFGQPSAPPAAAGASLGQPSAPPAATGFSFGVPTASPSAGAGTNTGFSFGASPTPVSPAVAAGGFSFGAPAGGAAAGTSASAPMFSFGSTGGDDAGSGATTPRSGRRPTRRLPNR